MANLWLPSGAKILPHMTNFTQRRRKPNRRRYHVIKTESEIESSSKQYGKYLQIAEVIKESQAVVWNRISKGTWSCGENVAFCPHTENINFSV